MATVLVVDDRATNREVARTTLDHGGYQVVEAAEGHQALDLAEHLHPDVILADVVMPGMDGYEFAHQLQTNPHTADIPVLLYTANFEPEEATALAAEYGVTTVVSKSADPLELLEAINQAVHTHPVTNPETPVPTDLASEHLKVVNAKLLEKVLALDESQARSEAFGQLAPVGIVFGGANMHATYVNARLAAILDKPILDLLGTGWLDQLPADCRNAVTSGIAADSHASCSVELIDPQGRHRWLRVGIRHVDDPDHGRTGFVAIFDDVTELIESERCRHQEEQRRVQAERRQIAERFDSLARLSGAVAHDFNNMLGVILSFTEMLDETIADTIGQPLTEQHAGQIRDDLDHVSSAAKRAAHLAHQLLTLGGRELVQPTVISVAAVIHEVHDMIKATAGATLTVRLDLADRLPNIRADASQLCQVLLNLAINARDAMPHGGQLTLSARKEQRRDADPDSAPVDDYVHIAVADNGHGMPPEVAEHAIEPFFTTKGRVRGTGLGLATAYGIVKQAGGQLTIDTAVDHGTTIHIHLPATDEQLDATPPTTAASKPHEATVLLAEDEDSLRHVAARLLTQAGYHVLAAANGAEALAVARQHPGHIGVVLTDVVMPVMTGPELADALHHIRPDIPVLYMSGYAAPLMTQQGVLPDGVTVINKPFTKHELLDALGTTLASQRAR